MSVIPHNISKPMQLESRN